MDRLRKRNAAYEQGDGREDRTIGPQELHMPARFPHPGTLQDVAKAHTRPFGIAGRPTLPLDARRLGMMKRTAVAAALQHRCDRHCLELFHVGQSQIELPIDQSRHVQPP